MKMTAILKRGMKVLLTSLMVFGVFAVTAQAQPKDIAKKFAFKVDKKKFTYQSSILDLPAGRLIVGGTVQDVEVSGGKGGCYTFTVTTYRLTPTGEKIPVRTISKKVCKFERFPEIVVDRIPQGRYLVELTIDRPIVDGTKFQGELTVAVQPERINLR